MAKRCSPFLLFFLSPFFFFTERWLPTILLSTLHIFSFFFQLFLWVLLHESHYFTLFFFLNQLYSMWWYLSWQLLFVMSAHVLFSFFFATLVVWRVLLAVKVSGLGCLVQTKRAKRGFVFLLTLFHFPCSVVFFFFVVLFCSILVSVRVVEPVEIVAYPNMFSTFPNEKRGHTHSSVWSQATAPSPFLFFLSIPCLALPQHMRMWIKRVINAPSVAFFSLLFVSSCVDTEQHPHEHTFLSCMQTTARNTYKINE